MDSRHKVFTITSRHPVRPNFVFPIDLFYTHHGGEIAWLSRAAQHHPSTPLPSTPNIHHRSVPDTPTSRCFLCADGILVGIGIWLFGLNLHYFHIIRIETGFMLRYTRSANEPLLHRSVYQMAFLLTALFGINITAFWVFTAGNEEMVKIWEIMPLMLFAVILGMFLWPFGGWHKRGRWRFLRYARLHPRLGYGFSGPPRLL